jgi:hypothetical protein
LATSTPFGLRLRVRDDVGLTFTLFCLPHSSNCRFSSLSVSGTKLAMVRGELAGLRKAGAGAATRQPPAAPPRCAGTAGGVAASDGGVDDTMSFPPFAARYLIAPEVRPERSSREEHSDHDRD